MMVPVELTTQSGATVTAYLSDPRLGLADALAGLSPSPTMRLITTDPIARGDVLTDPQGGRYRILRVEVTPGGYLAEVAKEA